MVSDRASMDEVRAATGAIAGHLRSAMLVTMIDLGRQLGLFEALAAGAATAAELADRASCAERPVMEWLGAVTTGGIVVLGEGGRFSLPPGMAEVLTGGGPGDLSRLAATPGTLAPLVSTVAAAFRTGDGVGYDAYRPAFAAMMDAQSRPTFDACLPDAYLAGAPAILERLRTSGGRVLDLGCGTGHATNVLAAALPLIDAVGVDLDADAIAAARAEATAMGLANARFEAVDVASVLAAGSFDLITAFDVIHDLPEPVGLVRAALDALAPGGVLIVVDVKAHTGIEHNLDHPMGPWMYGISTMHCLQVSLASGGPGLGACWGEERAVELLTEAGATTVDVGRAPADRANLIYTCRR